MNLMDTVNRIFDTAKEQNVTVDVAYDKLRAGASSAAEVEELKSGMEFSRIYYNEIVNARKTGDFSKIAEIIKKEGEE